MKPNKDSKTFCVLPWIHSHTSANGTFKPCCNAMGNDQPRWTSDPNAEETWYKTDNSDTNVARANDSVSIRRNGYTLSEWFESPYMNKLREDLNNGVQNRMCGRCWRDEARSGSSIRQRMNEKMADLIPESPQITYLDLKLTNQCNLKCRMCGPSDSHLIAQDVVDLEKMNLTVPFNYANAMGPRRRKQHLTASGTAQTQEDILQLLPNIKVMKITGGEPTLQPEVLELLDTAISKGYSKNIYLNITTNATKFTDRFLDKIEQFSGCKFNISVDGYGSVYDYIRYPFTWAKFDERITLLEQRYTANSDIDWGYTAVPQLFNIENLHKLQQRVGSERLYLNNVLHPDGIYNSLDIVPKHILQESIDNIKLIKGQTEILINYLNQLVTQDIQHTHKRLKDMVDSITAVDTLRKQQYNQYLEPHTVAFIEQSARTVA